jgi:hypothetical protein
MAKMCGINDAEYNIRGNGGTESDQKFEPKVKDQLVTSSIDNHYNMLQDGYFQFRSKTEKDKDTVRKNCRLFKQNSPSKDDLRTLHCKLILLEVQARVFSSLLGDSLSNMETEIWQRMIITIAAIRLEISSRKENGDSIIPFEIGDDLASRSTSTREFYERISRMLPKSSQSSFYFWLKQESPNWKNVQNIVNAFFIQMEKEFNEPGDSDVHHFISMMNVLDSLIYFFQRNH